jgi:hypothetical protein
LYQPYISDIIQENKQGLIMTTRQIAHGIAQLGRHGDSTLVHMQPHEVAGLQALAKANGTSMTINPHTGLPEAFSLGGFFSSLLPTLAGFGASAAFPEYALMAGISAGAATGALTNKRNPLMGAVMGGLGGYGGYGINNALQAAGTAGTGAVAADASQGMTNTLAKSGIDISNPLVRDSVSQELMRSGVGADEIANIMKYGPMTGGQAATAAETAANASQLGAMTAPTSKTFGETLGNAWEGAKNLASGDQASWDATRQAIAGAGAKPAGNLSVASTFGMPLVGATLGGLEPSDIYGQTVTPGSNPRDKYDPYATLNLSGDTGLKLLAAGGPVSFADGGDALKMQDEQPAKSSEFDAQINIMPVTTAQQLDNAQRQQEAELALTGQRMPYMGEAGGMNRELTLGQAAQALPAGGIGSLAPAAATAQTANTAMTAQTAVPRYNVLEAANLRKQYAQGGTISQGGMQDLYSTTDDTTSNVALSRDGYGLGRLNSMASGGVPGYADGGETSLNLDEIPALNLGTGTSSAFGGDTGIRYSAPSGPFGPLMTQLLGKMNPSQRAEVMSSGMNTWMGMREIPKQVYYTADGVKHESYAKGGYLDGPGDGMSDSIPATIEGKQPARLADGEFVIPADVVSHLGNGSTKAGSQRLYGMLDKVRKARTGTKKQGKQINADKYLPA